MPKTVRIETQPEGDETVYCQLSPAQSNPTYCPKAPIFAINLSNFTSTTDSCGGRMHISKLTLSVHSFSYRDCGNRALTHSSKFTDRERSAWYLST